MRRNIHHLSTISVRMKRRIACALFLAVLTACAKSQTSQTTTATPSPAVASPSSAPYYGALPIDGIRCDHEEGAVEHVHIHLQIFLHGKVIVVPAQIGIPPTGLCLYWVHTHANDGIIHIESPVKQPFTLGNFFDIWSQPLSLTRAASAVAPTGLVITVNGKPWHGADPRSISLADYQEIVINAGLPQGNAKRADWSHM